MTEPQVRLIVVAAVIVAGCAAYINTLDGEWVWDDASSVLLHKHVQDPSKFVQLFREDQHAFGRGAGNFYRPLVSASFMLDYALSYDARQDADPGAPYPRVKPFVFHLTNLFWHLAAALLLLALLTRMAAPPFVCAAVPLLFVVHPLHTEAVAYISGRADMMSATFMFAGLCCALYEGPPPRRGVAWALSTLCCCAALLSKESSFIFPFLLLLFILVRPVTASTPEQKKWAYGLRAAPAAMAALVMVVYGILRMTALRFAEAAPGPQSTFGTRLVETGQAFAFYLRVLFWPTGLHMEQSLAGTPVWTALLGSTLLGLCVAALAAAWAGKQHRIALGMGWFLLTWLPISGLFPLNAPMAEHWMYVPMAGFWWAVTEALWLAAKGPTLRRAAVAAVYALGVLFIVLTVQRNRDWHSNERLFRATLRENPSTLRVNYNLAVAYEDILHNDPGARRHHEAVLALHEAQKRARSVDGDTSYLLEDEIEVHLSLGRILARQGEYQRALQHFGPVTTLAKSEKYRAEVSLAALGLGQCFLALGEVARANAYLQQATSLNPGLGPKVQAVFAGEPFDD